MEMRNSEIAFEKREFTVTMKKSSCPCTHLVAICDCSTSFRKITNVPSIVVQNPKKGKEKNWLLVEYFVELKSK